MGESVRKRGINDKKITDKNGKETDKREIVNANDNGKENKRKKIIICEK